MNSMSYNEQTLVAAPDEEGRVIDSFVEASREINPTVQVTLAKRIVRPGSNKVLCLAARTSVPLNEDEMASVSDLALRLSDGTNVKLSLSFFNDEFGMVPTPEPQPVHRSIAGPSAPYISMSRSFFDPSRYTPYQSRNESKLGMAIFTVVLGITAGLYFVTESPLALLQSGLGTRVPKVQSAQIHSTSSTIKKAAILPLFKSPIRAASNPASKAAKLEKASLARTAYTDQIVGDAPKQNAPLRSFAPRKRAPLKQKQQNSLPPAPTFEAYMPQPERPVKSARTPKNMFVPPPPPTMYTIDPAMFPPYMQWQAPTAEAKAEKQEKASKRPASVQSALGEIQPVPAGTRSPVVSASSPVVTRSANLVIPSSTTVHDNSAKLENQRFDKQSVKAVNLSAKAASPSINSIANGSDVMRAPVAPMPGADQVSFERIRIPGQ